MDTILAKAMSDLSEVERILKDNKKRYENLQSHLLEISKEISSLEKERNSLVAFLDYYHFYSDGGMHLPNHGFRKLDSNQKNRVLIHPEFSEGTRAAEIESAVISILSKTNVPMKIKQLTDAVQNMGVEVVGQRPRTVVASVLSRSNKVYYDHPYGWRIMGNKKEENHIIEFKLKSMEMEYLDGLLFNENIPRPIRNYLHCKYNYALNHDGYINLSKSELLNIKKYLFGRNNKRNLPFKSYLRTFYRIFHKNHLSE